MPCVACNNWAKLRSILIISIASVYILIQPILGSLLSGFVSWTTITIYDWQRVLEILTVILIVVVNLFGVKSVKWCGWFYLLFLLVAVVGGVSLYLNKIAFRNGGPEFVCTLLLMLFYKAFGESVSLAIGKTVNSVVALSMFGSMILYLYVFAGANLENMFDSSYVLDGVWFPVFSNVRFFTDYQVMIFPFAIYLLGICKVRVVRCLLFIVTALFICLAFYTGSRVLLLGQLGCHAILFFFLRNNYLQVFNRHVVVWVGGVFLFLIFSKLVPFILIGADGMSVPAGEFARSTINDRLELWRQAIDYIISSPLYGIGPSGLAQITTSAAAAPHNGLLMLAAEWGLILPCCLVVLLAYWSSLNLAEMKHNGVSQCQRSEFLFQIAAWQSFLTLLIHAMVANTWVMPISQFGQVYLAGIVFHGNFGNVRSVGQGSRVISYLFGLFFPVLVVISMGWLLVTDVNSLPKRNRDYLECMRPTPYFSPRFWQQGWLKSGC